MVITLSNSLDSRSRASRMERSSWESGAGGLGSGASALVAIGVVVKCSQIRGSGDELKMGISGN